MKYYHYDSIMCKIEYNTCAVFTLYKTPTVFFFLRRRPLFFLLRFYQIHSVERRLNSYFKKGTMLFFFLNLDYM